jgi:parallel beta-helix repeat protein
VGQFLILSRLHKLPEEPPKKTKQGNRLMKNQLGQIIASSLLAALLSTTAAFGQGSLTPPGPPGPTMKSLDQIEPRTIVNAANTPGDTNFLFIISQPGSYYLTTNFVGGSGQSGIEIATNNVTLDLNGFTLQGGGTAVPQGYGIEIPNSEDNITVRNGTVSSWGSTGVVVFPYFAANILLERLNVFANGGDGIDLYGGGEVRDCVAADNGYVGLDGGGGANLGTLIVRDCTSVNSMFGISCGGGLISGCTVDNCGCGITLGSGIVSGCTVENSGWLGGIEVWSGTVSGCLVQNNDNFGICVETVGSEVIGNTCIGNNADNEVGSAGIYIVSSNNRIEDNHVTASGNAGILVSGNGTATNNVIIKNSVSGNGVNNYVVPAGNDLGPVGTAATATSPWANISN